MKDLYTSASVVAIMFDKDMCEAAASLRRYLEAKRWYKGLLNPYAFKGPFFSPIYADDLRAVSARRFGKSEAHRAMEAYRAKYPTMWRSWNGARFQYTGRQVQTQQLAARESMAVNYRDAEARIMLWDEVAEGVHPSYLQSYDRYICDMLPNWARELDKLNEQVAAAFGLPARYLK